jgi:hypothetical protein
MEAWALTENALIWRWNGQGWSNVPNPTGEPLFAIAVVSANAIWAAGTARMVYWDGRSWSLVSDYRRPGINAIAMLSPGEGWAVGTEYYPSGNAWRWNGLTWTKVYTSSSALRGVDVLSGIDGWAVGDNGLIVHWDGTNWAPVSSPVTTTLTGVSMVAPDDVWVVGHGWDYGNDGVILHWDGNIWTQAACCLTGARLDDVDMLSATDGWIVGWFGTTLHFNGTYWLPVYGLSEGDYLHGVDMLSTTDGWAVGNGGAWHWDGAMDGGSCTGSVRPGGDLHARTRQRWAVGGARIVHWDGATWTLQARLNDDGLAAIDAVSSTGVWAGGCARSLTTPSTRLCRTCCGCRWCWGERREERG